VSATIDAAAERLTLAVVNRHYDEAIRTSIEVHGGRIAAEGQSYAVGGDSDSARAGNSADAPDRVGVREQTIATASEFAHTFPAHSLTVLTLRCHRE